MQSGPRNHGLPGRRRHQGQPCHQGFLPGMALLLSHLPQDRLDSLQRDESFGRHSQTLLADSGNPNSFVHAATHCWAAPRRPLQPTRLNKKRTSTTRKIGCPRAAAPMLLRHHRCTKHFTALISCTQTIQPKATHAPVTRAPLTPPAQQPQP